MGLSPWLTSRSGTLIAGFVDLVIGLTGLSLIMLDSRGRHMILEPLVVPLEGEPLRYDYIKDNYQFLIEFLMPAIFLFLLGVLLISAATTKISCLVISSFVFSTIMVAGSVATLFCLVLSGAHLTGLIPYFVVTILQFIFYAIVVDFSRYAWDLRETEDKEMLVITTSKA